MEERGTCNVATGTTPICHNNKNVDRSCCREDVDPDRSKHCSSNDNDADDFDDDENVVVLRLPSQFRYNYKEIVSSELEEIVDDDENDIDDEREEHNMLHQNDVTFVLPNGMTILKYERFLSYLSQQKTNHNDSDDGYHYDDLKHVDYSYIDYGYCGSVCRKGNGGEGDFGLSQNSNMKHRYPLIIQQNKRIPGKGGFCWDAAFILSDYVIHQIQQQQHLPQHSSPLSLHATSSTTIQMIELGCGTGICGMYIAKHICNHLAEVEGSDVATPAAAQFHITLTDMDGPIQTLIQDNLRRNFHEYSPNEIEIFSEYMKQNHYPPISATNSSIPICGTPMITAQVLDWDDYYDSKYKNVTTTASCALGTTTPDSPQTATASSATYDIVFGSDIVATIYDPIKLAYTIYGLCHSQSVVYISYKERLSSIHAQFQNTLTQLFQQVTIFRTSTGQIIHDTSTCSTGSSKSDYHCSNDNDIPNHQYTSTAPPPSISENTWTSHNGNPNVYIILASHRIVCPTPP